MIRLLIALVIILLISAGLGAFLKNKFNFNTAYFTPYGFALYITLCQLGYYPAMWFNLSSGYEHIITLLISLFGLLEAYINARSIIEEFKKKETILILLAFGLFLFVFYHTSIDIEYSDAQMYLGYMSGNINTNHVSMFDLWTGLKGKEWDSIYLYQGYYHFGSSLCYFINIDHYLNGVALTLENITIQTWALAMIYSLISSMWIINFTSIFKDKKYIHLLVTIFGLFYLNFFYWRVALAFYGNTFRTITSSALIYTLYISFKEDRRDLKYLCVILSFSGIAFSSSYLFISFSIYYALMVYLFKNYKEGTIKEMADHVLPIVIYALSLFYKDNKVLCFTLLPIVLIYYLCRDKKFIKDMTDKLEIYLNKYASFFIYGTFIILALGTIYITIALPEYEYGIKHFFNNHQNYDMIKDFFFIYTGKSQNLVNIMRWLGLILLFIKEKDEKFLRMMILVLFIVFLNPLVTPMIAKTIASNVYYRTFDVIFNPFTEMMYFYYILKNFNHKAVLIIATLYVIYMLIYAHGISWVNSYSGEYGFHLHETVLPKYKIDNESYTAIKVLEEEIEDKEKDGQWEIVSHAQGLRTFIPDAHFIFTPYQEYYPNTRINMEFFEQARNHYSYGTYPETDFSSACSYLKRFDVDYLIINYHNNPDYDIEVSKCSDKIYENMDYRLYRYNKDN